MTDTEAMALGQRWVAAGGRWSGGMQNMAGERVIEVSRSGWPRFDGDDGFTEPMCAGTPDIRDAATRGAALEVVRERWGGHVWMGGRAIRAGRIAWVVCGLCRVDGEHVNGAEGFDTEAEAIVAALEAAPRREG